MDLAKLALFDTVMLVDDSGSMGELAFFRRRSILWENWRNAWRVTFTPCGVVRKSFTCGNFLHSLRGERFPHRRRQVDRLARRDRRHPVRHGRYFGESPQALVCDQSLRGFAHHLPSLFVVQVFFLNSKVGSILVSRAFSYRSFSQGVRGLSL